MNDPEEILAELRPFTDQLYVMFERAVSIANSTMESREWSDDPWTLSSLVRISVVNQVDSMGDGGEIHREPLPNNGIELEWGRFTLRVYKEGESGAPVARSSKRLLSFLNQEYTIRQYDFLELVPDDEDNKINLVTLWDVDTRRNLKKLVLCCPKAATRNSTSLLWNVPIPHPVESLAVDDLDVPDDDDDFGEIVPLTADKAPEVNDDVMFAFQDDDIDNVNGIRTEFTGLGTNGDC